MPVDIRSSTFTSSYTSGTLSIAKPSDMLAGDFLVVFLVAIGVHWGAFYPNLPDVGGSLIIGNPPLGLTRPAGGFYPESGPTPSQYPHDPPVAVLHRWNFAFFWRSSGSVTRGYFGNFWSNLGSRNSDGSFNTAGLGTWPFQYTWTAPGGLPLADAGGNPITSSHTYQSYSITAVARTVTGSEPSTLSFTLNNPLDTEYDYRALAICLTPNDWSGNYWDNPSPPNPDDAGVTGDKYLDGFGGWIATGSRIGLNLSRGELSDPTVNGNISTYYLPAPAGGPYPLHDFSDLDAYYLQSATGDWPPTPGMQADPENFQASQPQPPAESTDDIVLHLLAYAGPSSAGNPAGITIADLSATPAVDPLPILHTETWTKDSSSLLMRLSHTRATSNHAADTDGTGLAVVITSRVFSPDGPISAPAMTPNSNLLAGGSGQLGRTQEQCLGLAITFRVRHPVTPPPTVAIPARLATIVG